MMMMIIEMTMMIIMMIDNDDDKSDNNNHKNFYVGKSFLPNELVILLKLHTIAIIYSKNSLTEE